MTPSGLTNRLPTKPCWIPMDSNSWMVWRTLLQTQHNTLHQPCRNAHYRQLLRNHLQQPPPRSCTTKTEPSRSLPFNHPRALARQAHRRGPAHTRHRSPRPAANLTTGNLVEIPIIVQPQSRQNLAGWRLSLVSLAKRADQTQRDKLAATQWWRKNHHRPS